MAPKGFYLGPVSRQCLDGSTRGSKGPQITAGLGEVWCVREQLHSHFVYLSDTTRTRVLTLGKPLVYLLNRPIPIRVARLGFQV